MFKKKLPQWSMLPAEVEVTHFYGTGNFKAACGSGSDRIGIILPDPEPHPGPADADTDPYPFKPNVS
jgi:hypothetical protein